MDQQRQDDAYADPWAPPSRPARGTPPPPPPVAPPGPAGPAAAPPGPPPGQPPAYPPGPSAGAPYPPRPPAPPPGPPYPPGPPPGPYPPAPPGGGPPPYPPGAAPPTYAPPGAYPPPHQPGPYPPWPGPPPPWGAPPPPYHRPPGRRKHAVATWVMLAITLLVLIADVAVVANRRTSPSQLPLSVAVEQRLVTESEEKARKRAEERDAAIRRLFDDRAAAVSRRDQAAFLALLDPGQRDFVARQRQVFASLGKLDFAHWSYEPNGESYSPGGIAYARYGRITDLWLPVVILRYRLKGFDTDEVGRRVVYTVVRRGGRWYIAGDTDLEETTSSGTSVRVDPWENGPLVVERGASGIVIGHPQDRAAIKSIRREVEDAVRHVTRYAGRKKWNGKVVVILPADNDELEHVLENPDVPFAFGAVAHGLVTIPRGEERPKVAGSRVVINPDGFEAKGEAMTHLIRHEITHVATIGRTGPLTPKWLREGIAEYVGNAESDLPPEALASELAAEVEKNGVPGVLPTDSDFGIINDAGIAYNSAWLLCRYIVSEYGRAKLFEFHDQMGTRTGLNRPGEKLPRVLRQVFQTDEATLLKGYRTYVLATLADLPGLIAGPGRAYREVDRGYLTPADLAEQKGLSKKGLADALVERTAAGLWVQGPEKSPRQRVLVTYVVSETESGAGAVERMLVSRLRPYDASGRPLPGGRIYYVGTTIGGRHYNETIAVVRAGTVVVEVRTAVPGAGDSGAETRRVAAAQLAAVD